MTDYNDFMNNFQNLNNDLDAQLQALHSSMEQQLAAMGQDFTNGGETESQFCPECGSKIAKGAQFCPECGHHFQDEAATQTSNEQTQAPAKKHKYRVEYACRPYCLQMFRIGDEMKRRCLEAAANDELSEFWGDYAYNEGECNFDFEREVLTWRSQMGFTVYDEDDNDVFHTEDMSDFDLWGERDEDGDFTDFEGMPDGDYFIGLDTMKGSCWEGTFEAEDFDPKKLTFDRCKEIDDEFPLIGDDVMEVDGLRYDGQPVDMEFDSDNGSYGWTGYLYNCKKKDWWQEIKPEKKEDEEGDEDDEEDSASSDYDSTELNELLGKIDDAKRAYLEKAKERLEELFNIAAEKHEEDFGWQSDELSDGDEEEEERFEETKFNVIRYDDYAYQTAEVIGIRFRLENSDIVITAYYDDDSGEIVEDCDLYFNYEYAENYRAVARCIEIAERELGLGD